AQNRTKPDRFCAGTGCFLRWPCECASAVLARFGYHCRGVGLGRERSGVARQIELDRRATSQFTIDRARPARALDETIDLRKPEPGAFAVCLRGEERLKDLVANLGRHPAASVGDRYDDMVPSRQTLPIGSFVVAD